MSNNHLQLPESTDVVIVGAGIAGISAAWYLIFALPLFFFTPDRKSHGVALAKAIPQSFLRLPGTWQNGHSVMRC